jgi:hypothetical protein
MLKISAPLLCMLLVVLSGCVKSESGEIGGTLNQTPPTVDTAPSNPVLGPESATLPDRPATSTESDPLEASAAELIASIPGEVGIAIASADGVRVYGSWTVGPAWSTIKVPLAVAGLRSSYGAAQPLVPLAIRDSNNEAAERIWSELGPPVDAAKSVQSVLRDGGDTSTIVQSQRVRPEFTAFGQTLWSTNDQAQFASSLPCLEASETVLNDMRSLATNQQWGLALRADTASKGGWGPSEAGAYLVRQLAVITTQSGNVGVALAATPSDGTLETGIDQVRELSDWLGRNLDKIPGKACQ